jgi:hypothetical protein
VKKEFLASAEKLNILPVTAASIIVPELFLQVYAFRVIRKIEYETC